MNTAFDHETVCWAKMHFGDIQLFNRKKTRRLVCIASRLAENKGVSLARLFDRWYDVKATYNLLNHKIMDPDTIQSEHRKLTFEAMASYTGDVLAIEDASEFEWNWKETIPGLGPIGSGRKKDQGFLLQSTLAIGIEPKTSSEEGHGIHILGLAFQQYHVRVQKKKKGKKRRAIDEYLETDLWRTVIQKEILPRKRNIIRVCDRAADIYEVLVETQEYGCGYIIRLKHDRLDLETQTHLQEQMRELPAMGMTRVDKRDRRLELEINWKETELRAPQRPKGKKLEPLKSTVVRVWGKDPKSGEVVEWFLHTNLPVNSLKDAIKVTQYYALRWIIEDYHKALKTGLRAEDLQCKTAHALFAAISIMSVVALRLVNLREKLRIAPEEPAEKSGLSIEEIKVLGTYLKREIKTVKCVALAIGRLGGHQNRKSDGMPGLLALWWGMSRFLTIMEGVRLATI
jgi:hypothetical protein